MQVQQTKSVPMAMQIWKHRRSGGEVKILWANGGKVGVIATGCVGCSCSEADRCGPDVYEQSTFMDVYAYARAF